jgi:hypothetical protein
MGTKGVALGIIIGVLIIGAVWYFYPLIQQSQIPSNAVRVVVNGNQFKTETIGGHQYVFGYIEQGTGGAEQPYLSVVTPEYANVFSAAINTYVVTVGKHYGINLYGEPITVIISEVQDDYLVLQVVPP